MTQRVRHALQLLIDALEAGARGPDVEGRTHESLGKDDSHRREPDLQAHQIEPRPEEPPPTERHEQRHPRYRWG